jgi:hypothetical protein
MYETKYNSERTYVILSSILFFIPVIWYATLMVTDHFLFEKFYSLPEEKKEAILNKRIELYGPPLDHYVSDSLFKSKYTKIKEDFYFLYDYKYTEKTNLNYKEYIGVCFDNKNNRYITIAIDKKTKKLFSFQYDNRYKRNITNIIIGKKTLINTKYDKQVVEAIPIMKTFLSENDKNIRDK